MSLGLGRCPGLELEPVSLLDALEPGSLGLMASRGPCGITDKVGRIDRLHEIGLQEDKARVRPVIQTQFNGCHIHSHGAP